MPIYLFRCPTCGTEKEVIQAYATPPPVCMHVTGVTVMERSTANFNWQRGDGPKESAISAAIRRAKRAEAKKR